MSDKNCQESDLLSAAEHGKIDPATVADLYARYGAELQRFLMGLLRDWQLAADAVQATFAKLTEYGHNTREESRKGWLFRVAYREAMLLRRRQATDDAALRRTAWEREPAGESAEAELVKTETVERVRQAINELSAEQQRVVRMRIYDEKTFAVIAAELGIPLGTALGRMRTAMSKLRTKLDEQ
ncbi:MAG: sigma-70 family RNA polymerase sigma factor [Pirellulaceae bacterium]|nr:sigma-70 family RNA polymerase sigma factor [Pirellulaceae bacterium]